MPEDLTTTKDVEDVIPKVIGKVEPIARNKWKLKYKVNLIKGWTEDYNPKDMNDKQLGDDYRIVMGWYTSLKEGKELFKHVNKEEKKITLDDCKNLELSIFKEMVERGFSFNEPSTYKSHSKELFEWIIEKVGTKNIPWKSNLGETPGPINLKIEYWPHTYSPAPKFDNDLRKDWSRFFRYYIAMEKGQKFFVLEGESVNEILKSEVKNRTLLLFKELIERGKKFSMRKYKGKAKDLFDWLVEQVGVEKVPFKEVKPGTTFKKIPFNPLHITKKDLPDIDPITTKIMSSEELFLIHEQLHRMESIPEGVPQAVEKAHRFIVNELLHRNLEHVKKEGMLDKLSLNPSTIDRSQLELIDDVYIKSLSDVQLKDLHERLHILEKEIGKITEPLQNSHIFIWSEMKRRNMLHNIATPLDHKTSLEVVEYPKPEEGIPQELKEYSLEEVLKLFPEQIVVGDPIHVYLCGGTVNREKILQGHDLDILFKQPYLHKPTVKAFLNELANVNPEIAKDVHFVWDQEGPQIGYNSALYRLAYIRVKPEEMVRKSPCDLLSSSPTLFKPYIGLKPKSGFEKNEFWDLNDMWQKWAKDRIDVGIAIEEKYDGMRMQIHVDGDKVKIYTEDRQRDRAVAFKKSIEELLKGKKVPSFILDAEMVEYACGQIKTNHPELVCKQSPRENQIKWIAASPEKLDDEDIVFNIHDCVFINGKSINDQGYLERWKQISECFPDSLRHWARVPCKVAETQKQFFTFASEFRRKMNAEGVVCKVIDSKYPMKYSGENRAADWAKLKNLKEIDVMVWKIIQKKTSDGKLLDQYLYDCIFSIPCSDVQKFQATHVVRIGGKCYSHIGRTYSTSIKVHAGDIITVRPIRISEYKDDKGQVLYTWMFPYFDSRHIGKTEPDSIDVVKKLMNIGTSPLSTMEEDLESIQRLLLCPFFDDQNVCPLKERFAKPMDELSITKTEYLKYPIICKLANSFKCRYVKPYYYDVKKISVPEKETEVDEDTGEVEKQ